MRRVALASGAVVLLVAGVAVGLGAGGLVQRSGGGTAAPRPTVDATVPVVTGGSATESDASPDPGPPTAPDEAAALDADTALAELDRQAATDREAVLRLDGSWVPQVSSKCPGVSVDIGPGWEPDGVEETRRVTASQILAFHLSLRSRFGALMARPTQVGIDDDVATRGVCRGKVTWMSLVPVTFASAADANAWCDTNVAPVHECQARLVVPGGESQTEPRG